MCEPTTLAIASLAATAASAGMSAIGASKQAEAQASAARYQAQVADNARKVAEWQAEDALKRGRTEEDRRRTKTALQISAQRAALASSGTLVEGEGSNIDITGDTAAAGEFDALTIRSNAERDAWSKRVQASNLHGEAALQRSKAAFADEMGMFGVGANLIAGASSVADKWSSYRKSLL